MPINAGKLRHRIIIQRPDYIQDMDNGAMNPVWVEVATVWASIDPISAREFVASQAEVSNITTRITIRYRSDLDDKMRLYHPAKDIYYDLHGILYDKDSGLDYMTLPCSEGVKYQ